MRALFVLVVAVVLAIVAGWLTFSRSQGTATITIHTEEVRKDAREAVEKGTELLEKARDNINESSTNDRHQSVPDEPARSSNRL